jgi:hypothetical protein
MKKCLSAALALAAFGGLPALSAAPLPAQLKASARHVVTMKVFDARSVVTSPQLIASSTRPATFSTGNAKQRLALVVTAIGRDQFRLQGNLAQWTRTGLITDNTNIAVNADGHPQCITFWKRDPATGEKRPIHVDVTISSGNAAP